MSVDPRAISAFPSLLKSPGTDEYAINERPWAKEPPLGLALMLPVTTLEVAAGFTPSPA